MSETYEPPSPERIKELEKIGLTLDELGRPRHPWLGTRDIDLPDDTALWRWGPNAAADAIIFNTDKPEVLLIQRNDGTWANAGGFVDATDPHAAAAAAREAGEEAGVELDTTDALPVYNGIVHDTRSSKYSWVTTSAFLWRRSIQLDMLTAGDDADDIRLAHLADIRKEQLYGSHNHLIDQAVEKHGTLHEKLHYYREDIDSSPIDAGHMGYEKFIAALPTGQRLFIKKHIPEPSADMTHSTRLLEYLHKEHAVYEHLMNTGYPHIPSEVEFKDNAIIMHALNAEDGWTWEIPETEPMAYINTALAAIKELEMVPDLPIDFDIVPSHVSYMQEGWNAYSPKTRTRIIDQLRKYAAMVRAEAFSQDSLNLIEELDDLYKKASKLPMTDLIAMSHHDFRQSNFAYHPKHGVRIVDWSWAGPGMQGSDATTLLIDLHKQGLAVDQYMTDFNKDHALIMIGFWLMRGSMPVHQSHDVRFQQIHSAVAAHTLYKSVSE